MTDEQLPGEQDMTKRERQKARRQQKLQAEASAAKSEKAKKGIATTLVAVLVLGALGVFGFNAFSERQDRANRIADARENLGALGCTEVEVIPPAASPHLDGSQLASSAPEAIYPDRPATSGPHIGNIVQSGFFDKVVDERLLVHNLEHGYVHIYFDQDVPDETVGEIRDFVEGLVGGSTQKIIASRWKADLPGDANYALTSWGARQTCEQWDQGVAEAFISEYHYLEGTAPERTIRPHLGGTNGGGIDPNEEDGDLLFPPLDTPDDVDVDEALEEPEGVTEEGEEGPRDDALDEDGEPTDS